MTFRAVVGLAVFLIVWTPEPRPAVQETAPRLGDYRWDGSPSAQWELHRRLREVSGLALTPDGRLFGHDDEQGIIYEIDQADGTLRKGWAFGDPTAVGDFEGITVVDSLVYLVTSTGRLYEGREGNDGDRVPFNTYDTGVRDRCEVEGLAYDPSDRVFLLACKTPLDRGLEDVVSVFQWSHDRWTTPAEVRVRVPLDEIEARLGRDRFRPSGIARHPVTGSLFLLASQGGAGIIEVSPDGRLLDAVRLSSDSHGQPEGIAITPDRRLWIADEGGRGRGRLAVYRPTR